MNTGQSATDWREKPGAGSKAGSSHMATGLNQSFREQEEEDYDDEGDDAQIFEKTTLPPENYTRGGTDSAHAHQ